MQSQTHYRLRLRTLALALTIVAAVLVVGVVAVSAVDPFPGLPGDGRINIVHHFGGDALYCVDANGNPTDQFSDGNLGGMRLLNIDGQELWFVPAADIEAAVVIAQTTPGIGVEVFSGPGTYGPSYLYVFADLISGEVKFQFTAFDEWGKTNTMEFKFCEPIGPTQGGTVPGGPTCGVPERSDEYCSCVDDFCQAQSGCNFSSSQDDDDDDCDIEAYEDCFVDLAEEFCKF